MSYTPRNKARRPLNKDRARRMLEPRTPATAPREYVTCLGYIYTPHRHPQCGRGGCGAEYWHHEFEHDTPWQEEPGTQLISEERREAAIRRFAP